MKCAANLIATSLSFLLSHSSFAYADRNERDEAMLFCSADPDLYDLLAHAGQLDLDKQSDKSIELQRNLLEIRPNCYDVHLSIGMTYAVTGDEKRSRYHYRRFEELTRRYQDTRPLPAVIDQPVKQPEKPTRVAPAKKDKINYWKWLYIYSVLKKR
jgi:hypothetical protein